MSFQVYPNNNNGVTTSDKIQSQVKSDLRNATNKLIKALRSKRIVELDHQFRCCSDIVLQARIKAVLDAERSYDVMMKDLIEGDFYQFECRLVPSLTVESPKYGKQESTNAVQLS
jgi:hypothetical protein